MTAPERADSSWATLGGPESSLYDGPRDIIAIGAAAGGLSAICKLLSRLPPVLDAAVLIALDAGSQPAPTVLQILRGYSHLPVGYGTDGALVRRRCVVVAPVRHHMSVTQPGIIRLEDEHSFCRTSPSVNRLFETCAATYGQRVIGVVLSGGSRDGTAGLKRIEGLGGIGVVQRPEEAVDARMPSNAMHVVHPACCSPLERMAPLLVTLASGARLLEEFPRTDKGSFRSSAGKDCSDYTGIRSLSTLPRPGRRRWLQQIFG
jgi:two-component system chemotaxis response regulator CheB